MVCAAVVQKKGYTVAAYRSASQNSLEFDRFTSNFDKKPNDANSSNPDFVIILWDFNFKSKSL